jgi:exopolysaccharide biosynthesis polyprenyl glycosylphosphotransferase
VSKTTEALHPAAGASESPLPDPADDSLPRLAQVKPETGPGPERSRLARMLQGRRWSLLRVGVDALMLVLGVAAALVGAPAADASMSGSEGGVWLMPPLTIGLLALWRMYRDTIQLRAVDGLAQVVAATSLAAISLIAAADVFSVGTDAAPLVARAWFFGTIYLAGGRIFMWWTQRRARVARIIAKPTLIVGAGQIGARVEHRLATQPELGLLPVGYLDSDPPPDHMVPDRSLPVLGPTEHLGAVAERTGARHVVLGFSSAPDSTLIPLVRECEIRGLEMSLVPRLFESVNVHVALDHLGGLPLFGLHAIDPQGWQFAVKHALDRIGAAALLLVLAPLLLLLALLVRLTSPGPALFRQRRVGRDGREFEMLKFRTMRMPDQEGEGEGEPMLVSLPPDLGPGGVEGPDRRTWIGGFMRASSLDELPQLLNVLKGEMSLVGPRPERPQYAELFGSQVARYTDRHRVKSGITGWAQVNGLRGRTSLSDRVEWDNFYIANWSLGLDLKIVLMTLAAPFHRAE